MCCPSPSPGNIDPLSSWEAPWNHMKYFWHNEPEPSNEQARGKVSAETETSSPRKQVCYHVYETNDGCKETRGLRPRREIIAVKPAPWRNVHPPTPPPLPGKISCTCGAPKIKTIQQEKSQQPDLDIKQKQNVLKFKKSPQTISYCKECVQQWKEDANDQAVADMFQSIRDAPTEKPPGRTCEGEFIIPTDYCSFCNQPLSAFGFCNECLPPTPSPKPAVVPQQNKIPEQKITNECSGVTSSLPSSYFMNPCKLLQEINNFQPTFVPPENCNPLSKPNKACSIPQQTLIQSQNMHDQLERDCRQGAFSHSDPFKTKDSERYQISHLTKTDHFRNSNVDQFPNTEIFYKFHHPNDCPYRNTRQPDSNSNGIQNGRAVTQPKTSAGNPLSHWPMPEGFPSPESLPQQPSTAGRQGGTMSHFGVTLEVGNTSAQNITVVLYANRILVAEAVNFTVNGEIVSAQSWSLPNDVDIETLRCYLGDGKLYIVSFPPPPGFNWRFASYPAALGPPKFSNQPCPFEL